MTGSEKGTLHPHIMSSSVSCSPKLDTGAKRRSLRAGRRKSIIQTSKITTWLKESVPSIKLVPADPSPSHSPTDSIVPADPCPQETTNKEEKMKKKRRRRTKRAGGKGGDASLLVSAASQDCSMVSDDRPIQHNSTSDAKNVAEVSLIKQSPSSLNGLDEQEMDPEHRNADSNMKKKDLPSL